MLTFRNNGKWIGSFMQENYTLKVQTLPNPGTQNRSCIDLTFANKLCCITMAEPLAIYQSDHRTIP